MEILKAHNQWKTRPADQRYWDLPEMLEAAKTVKDQSREVGGVIKDLRVEARDEELVLIGKQERQATVSNYAFGQLANRVGAPAGYLRELPATLAAQNLNHGLKALSADEATDAKLLFNVNGSLVLRAATTARYARYWNADLVQKVLHTLPSNWKTPRAWPAGLAGERTRTATQDDVMSGSIIKAGDTIAPAGAYLSDKDMFMFLIDTESEVRDGTAHPMHRGIMLWNSEVGDRALGGMTFLLKPACGNHRIMGASDVCEFSHRHIGDITGNMEKSFEVNFRRLSDDSVSDVEAKITAERKLILGVTKEEVVAQVLGFAKKKSLAVLTKKLLNAAYDKAVEHEAWYGNPNSLYGIQNGITEMSQVVASHVDERVAIDTAAAKLLDMSQTF